MEQLTNYLGTQIVFDSDRNDGAILRLVGEIDMATSPVMAGVFRDLLDLGVTEVIIDGSRVTFMDSTGLHALVEGKRLIHDQGMKLALVASPQMRRVLEIVFPEPLFAARVDTLEQAREARGWKDSAAVGSDAGRRNGAPQTRTTSQPPPEGKSHEQTNG